MAGYEPRSRQACEPCRRKKSKCTGERPACSFCKRLNQQCQYRSRETAQVTPRTATATASTRKRTRKSSGLRDQVQQLESQVKDIYEILHTTSNHDSDSSPQNVDPGSAGETRLDEDEDTNMPNSIFAAETATASTFPDPSPEILADLTEIYRVKLHLQPIPLFRMQDLADCLTSSPRFLLCAFSALVLSIGGHDNYREKQAEAIEYYARSAEDTVRMLSLRGIARLEVVQALCLLALRDIHACKPAQAWMTIGTASRLESCRALLGDDSLEVASDRDLSARCRWSVFLLERIFSPQFHTLTKEIMGSQYPPSAPIPAIPPARKEDYPSDLYNYNANHAITDLGITAYHIEMASLWGQVAGWMHEIRIGHTEASWRTESNHARLTATVYEIESQLPHEHLLRNVGFSNRSSEEIFQHREYWTSWLLMQVISHAAPAIINHPFIYLVAMREAAREKGRHQPNIFLQHTVDAALFHSGWVFRLLRFGETKLMELNDPLLGHLVSAVATIPWLFQFAADERVSQRAVEDLAWCKRYLERAATVWPHLSQKLDILQNLQVVANHYRQQEADKNTSIFIQASLFWTLLDPEVCHMTPPREAPEGQIRRIPDARVRITTHFAHPLAENESYPLLTPGLDSANDPILFNQDELEQVYLDDLFSHFIPMDTMEGL